MRKSQPLAKLSNLINTILQLILEISNRKVLIRRRNERKLQRNVHYQLNESSSLSVTYKTIQSYTSAIHSRAKTHSYFLLKVFSPIQSYFVKIDQKKER